MPQLQQIDTFASQIFWLIVCFAALFIILRWVALPKVNEVLEARRRKIEGDLEKAASLKAEAEKALAQYEAAVAQGREQAQALLRKVGDAAQKQAAAAQESLGQRLAKEIKGAEERIEAARKSALTNVERVSAELAQAATERLIGVKVDALALGPSERTFRGSGDFKVVVDSGEVLLPSGTMLELGQGSSVHVQAHEIIADAGGLMAKGRIELETDATAAAIQQAR